MAENVLYYGDNLDVMRRHKTLTETIAPVGTTVWLDYDVERRDRYGRDLAYIYLPVGRMLNEELLGAGMAVVSVHPPNIQHVGRFQAASVSAKAAGAGLWSGSACECLPADHRAGHLLIGSQSADTPAGGTHELYRMN